MTDGPSGKGLRAPDRQDAPDGQDVPGRPDVPGRADDAGDAPIFGRDATRRVLRDEPWRETDGYSYVRHGRSAGHVYFLGLAVIVLLLTWDIEMLAFAIPAALGAIYCAYEIWRNASWGMTLDAERIVFFSGKWRESVPLDEVSEIDIVRTSEEYIVRLVRGDRTRFKVPTKCYEGLEQLEFHCGRYGVRVTREG